VICPAGLFGESIDLRHKNFAENPLRVKTNLSNRINVICPVQISLKKYSA